MLMFKLKALDIYMDVENKTELDIRVKLNRNNFLRISYICTYIVLSATHFVISYQIDGPVISTPSFGWFHFFIEIFSFFLIISVEIYIACSIIRM